MLSSKFGRAVPAACLMVAALTATSSAKANETAGSGWSTLVIRATVNTTKAAHDLSGLASYYWQGQTTASGAPFDKRAMTAAHRTLPFGTRVRVTRLDTGSSVIVRINDRGPFKAGRVIDLSEKAAEMIGMTGKGLTRVSLDVLGR